MKRSRAALLAVAVALTAGAASIVVVDRSENEGDKSSMTDPAAPDRTSKDRPKLPRTNVQSETIGMFTARLPEALAAGLQRPAERAPAYEIRASKGTAVAIRLRDALGLAGEPVADAAGVIVADTGSDRVLRVVFAPGNPWMMYRGDPACLRTPDAGIAPDGRIFCMTEQGNSESDRLLKERTITEEQARSVARQFMSGLGLDVRNIIVSDHADAGWGIGGGAWGVAIETAVGGLPAIGLDTHLSIAEEARVTSGYGMVVEPKPLGDYPLVDVSEAHARLTQWLDESAPRSPIEFRRGEAPAEPPTTIVGARLALAFSEPPVPSGTRREVSYLVPTFVLDASDGRVFPIPAVTADHLAE